MITLSKVKAIINRPHPKPRYIYAVTAGVFLGELLVYIETIQDDYHFLSLPTMTIRTIPINKFESGYRDNIVEVVEKLPPAVYKVCKKQYSKNKTSFNTVAV